METHFIPNDISVYCVTAISFPEGVGEAHSKLRALTTDSNTPAYFGISHPGPDGVIIYKAAATETYPGEGKEKGCETFIIPKGNYICITINDFMKNEQRIGQAFSQLIAQPGIHPQGFCLEWYLNDLDVKCMVPLK